MPTNWAGPDLASLRCSKGISLRQIAENTKIAVRYLEAIESGHFSKLPGGYYDVSYIRQYAQAVDYDEADLLQRYQGSVAENPSIAASPVAEPKTSARVFYQSPLARWFDLRIWRNVSTRMLRKI